MRHRAASVLKIYGLTYVADHTNGKLYEFSADIYDDDGKAIVKQRDSAAIHGGLFERPGKRLFFDKVEFVIAAGTLDVEGTGLGPQVTYNQDTLTSEEYPTVADMEVDLASTVSMEVELGSTVNMVTFP